MHITFAQAIALGTCEALRAYDRAQIMGLGVETDPGRIFGTIPGLEFVSRLVEMPCSEAAMTGIAVGAALEGCHTILVHQRVEFALLAMEQIVNNAAKLSFISNGRYTCPILMRLIIGRGWGQGPTHGQSLEALWCAIPGLRVVYPTTPADAYAVMAHGFGWQTPTIVIEHRWLHDTVGEVDLKKASSRAVTGTRHVAVGDRCTVVTYGMTVLEAARAIADIPRQVDLFDLRWLQPLDLLPVVQSALRTGRVLLIEDGDKLHGIMAEVAARLLIDPPLHQPIEVHRMGPSRGHLWAARTVACEQYIDAYEIYEKLIHLDWIDPGAQGYVEQLKALLPTGDSDRPNPDFRGPF